MTPIKTLESRIPNLYDFFTKEEVENVLKGFDESEEVEDYFMFEVWDKPVRRCSICGRLMDEGYVLGSDYACSDECRNAEYKKNNPDRTEEELEKVYLYEYFEASHRGISLEDWMTKPIEECREFDEYGGDMCYYTTWE